MKRKIKYFIQITLIAMLFWNCSSNKKDAVELNTNRQNQLNLENTYKVVQLEKIMDHYSLILMKPAIVYLDFLKKIGLNE